MQKKIPDTIEYVFWVIIILTTTITSLYKEIKNFSKKEKYLTNKLQLILSILYIIIFIISFITKNYNIVPILVIIIIKNTDSIWLYIEKRQSSNTNQ